MTLIFYFDVEKYKQGEDTSECIRIEEKSCTLEEGMDRGLKLTKRDEVFVNAIDIGEPE